MAPTVHLDFDPYNADHRRIAQWLMAQPDPAEAVVRLVRAASEGEQRLRRWGQLATQLAGEIEGVRTRLGGRPAADPSQTEVAEDPESARRLDSIFEQGEK